jgi:hypothetical protein
MQDWHVPFRFNVCPRLQLLMHFPLLALLYPDTQEEHDVEVEQIEQ